MITSFSVGAVFTIVDEATPVLSAMAEKLRMMEGLVGRLQEKLDGLGVTMRETASKASAMASGMNDAFARIDDMVGVTTAGVKGLVKEMQAAAVEMKGIAAELRGVGLGGAAAGAANPLAMRSAQARTRYGFQQMHARAYMPLPGGVHAGIGGLTPTSIAGLGAAAGIAYGVEQEMSFEDAAFRILYGGDASVSGTYDLRQAQQERLRDMMQNARATQGLPVKTTEEAMLKGFRLLKGLPWEQQMKLMPGVLNAAGIEAAQKGTTLGESVDALVGVAHMVGAYEPSEQEKLWGYFAYLSTADPRTLTGMERAAGYDVPTLYKSMGVDPLSAFSANTVLAGAGILNTKSGTWVREAAQRGMLPFLPENASKSQRRNWEQKRDLLKTLGLVGDDNKSTWMTDGKFDILKEFSILSETIPNLPMEQRSMAERFLFGTQGAGAISMFTDPTIRNRWTELDKESRRFSTDPNYWQRRTEESPQFQARRAWADFSNVMMDIGRDVLPIVTMALKGFDEAVKGLKNTVGDKALAGALTGVAAGALMSWMGLKPPGPPGGGGLMSWLPWLFKNPLIRGAGTFGLIDWGLSSTVGDSSDIQRAVEGNRKFEEVRRRIDINPLKLSQYEFDSMRGGMDLEAQRGRALSALPAPQAPPIVNTIVNVKALLNGKEIAAAIVKDVINDVIKGVTGALHISNLMNQGSANGSLDAPHAAGAEAN